MLQGLQNSFKNEIGLTVHDLGDLLIFVSE